MSRVIAKFIKCKHCDGSGTSRLDTPGGFRLCGECKGRNGHWRHKGKRYVARATAWTKGDAMQDIANCAGVPITINPSTWDVIEARLDPHNLTPLFRRFVMPEGYEPPDVKWDNLGAAI